MSVSLARSNQKLMFYVKAATVDMPVSIRGFFVGLNKMIEIKNRFTGCVIMTLDVETLNGADLSGADLRGANLRGADLSNANLSGADLSNANLSGADLRNAKISDADLNCANLRGANLRSADLNCANLSGANLNCADLRGADLRNAKLSGVIGNLREIASLHIDGWVIVFTSEILAIGCQQHTIDEWRNFDDAEISRMASSALEWWKKYKEFIFMAIELRK